MRYFTRRRFLAAAAGTLCLGMQRTDDPIITVNGAIRSSQLGQALIHEHFLVDFIGADKITQDRWDRSEVIKVVLPYLQEAKDAGIKTIFDCTPDFLGRDVALLKMLAEKSGLQIVTNTGYYGAQKNKFLPPWAFTESAEQLASRWINEFEKGIQDTDVKPGFIKIGVDSEGPLSDIHRKLVKAAALTHLRTGLTICSHTGPALAAFEELEILNETGVHPGAFVWVHAQAEKDKTLHIKGARQGCWISLDGIGWGEFDNYVTSIVHLKSEGLLHKVLISHDAGWYKPGEPANDFKGYTNIFSELFPRLRQKGFSNQDFEQLLIRNPAEAMIVRVRKV